MMEFALLRSFAAVAECGGFRRAAERLNLTQSTVSQQIKRLELETKRPLFRRTTRAVALTHDGEMLLGDARRLFQFEEAARHRLAVPQVSGTVRLGVVEEVARGARAVLWASPWSATKQSFKAGLVRSSMKPNGSRLPSSTAPYDL
jgi:DNA-binding transcriptional LysR family regulator